MATDTVNETQTDPEIPDAEAKPKFRINLASKKVKILLLLLLVMAVEAAGFYFLLPGATGGSAAGEDGEMVSEDGETVEISVSSFTTVNAEALPGRRYLVEFKLTVVVPKSQQTAFELAANKEHKAEVKMVVEWVVRNSSIQELNDSRHRVIRRKIKEEINKVLRKSFVQRVILTSFRALEQ